MPAGWLKDPGRLNSPRWEYVFVPSGTQCILVLEADPALSYFKVLVNGQVMYFSTRALHDMKRHQIESKYASKNDASKTDIKVDATND